MMVSVSSSRGQAELFNSQILLGICRGGQGEGEGGGEAARRSTHCHYGL